MRTLACVAMFLLVGCQAGSKILTPEQARSAGDRYLAAELPQIDLQKYDVAVTDAGKTWRVVYDAPSAGTGGQMVLLIDKKAGKVVGGEMQQ